MTVRCDSGATLAIIEWMVQPLNSDTAKTAPDFVLRDTAGREFGLSDFKNKSPVVLVFNRGFF
ncbi:hypothetical protein Dform_00429 [Dehalogenimonas formicexedens]|uniref:AhpC/TSA family protein n=1 Tax=Dehalogenimonas formicexedens TaxID=1839801 RepID=A0A1P8F5N4_9CHLR|nr:hypothetical protein [Dehalogenimonas formicexedens]APV43787.1 hypothetical protein Dform_00429 [Dehalogenimonas formicexedens]